MLLSLGMLVFTGCNKDDDVPEEVTVLPIYQLIINGNAAVSSINDPNDDDALNIVQAVPSVSNQQYPSSMPILLFFNDKLSSNSIVPSFEVKQNGTVIGGKITINEGANGYAVLTFVPSPAFSNNASITLTITSEMQDDGGNGLANSFSLAYETISDGSGNFDSNGGFENGADGISFIGDGAIMQGSQGCVDPVSGSHFAAITTGNQLISSGSAIGNASSTMILGSLNSSISSITFMYNFLSAEFQEYVDSEFDDSVIVTLVGSNGATSEFLTSVNTIGTAGNTQCVGFPNLPDAGDTYAGATGWISKTISTGSIGSPVYIILTITDVSDTAYSSVLAIDDVTTN